MTSRRFDLCWCGCHQADGMKHIIPCCKGQCPRCERHVADFDAHEKYCPSEDSNDN